MPLRPRQQRFVEEYLLDLNATQAAIRAGYKPSRAEQTGCDLVRNRKVAEAITAGQARRSERTEITQDRVLTELGKLGFANMLDYMVAGPDGDPYLDFSALTRDQAAALQEVTVESFTVAGEPDEDREDPDTLEEQPHGGALRRPARRPVGREVRRIKFKLADKRAALVDIGRHLGMFKDRIELSGTVNNADRDQIAADIAEIFGLPPLDPAGDAEGDAVVVSRKAHRGEKARPRAR